MDLGLKDRVAVVTGASKGMGRSVALALAGEGAAVVLCSRRVEALEEVREEIERLGGRASAISADARDPRSADAVVRSAVEGLTRRT